MWPKFGNFDTSTRGVIISRSYRDKSLSGPHPE